MEYVQVSFSTANASEQEMLIGELSEYEFLGFEQHDNQLCAFIGSREFDENIVKQITEKYNIPYSIQYIKHQNWNAEWEANFKPVVIGNFCTIRAGFHAPATRTEYEIIITPKMSFGTGHHATTHLMVQQMETTDFKDKRVLDFGTGTGVLAILAEKLGAASVVAIDNDEWSVENAGENIEANSCSKIKILNSELEGIADKKFDVILANINRHILLHYMNEMYSMLADNGMLIMSGLLAEDEKVIMDNAVEAGFSFQRKKEMNGWICMELIA